MALFSRDLLNLQRNVDSMFNSMRNQYFGSSDNLLGGSSFFAPTLMDLDLDLEPSSLFTPSALLLTSSGGNNDAAFPSKDHTALQQNQQAPNSSNGGRIQHNHQPMDLLAGISSNAWNQLSQMHLDVHATPQAYTVTCDLPGVEKSSIDIQADQRTHQLTISAERRSEHIEHETTSTGSNGTAPSSGAETKPSTNSPSGSNSAVSPINSSVSTNTAGSTEKTDQQVAAPQQQAVSTNVRPRIVRQERFYGKTQRSVRLAQDADLERVEAKYENGVLTLTVPRKERQPEPNRFKKVQVL